MFILLLGALTLALGLFQGHTFRTQLQERGKSIDPSLAASVIAGKNGAFRFDNLTAGRYTLSALVSKDAVPRTAGVKASRHPGIRELSRRKPSLDAGTISIRTVKGGKRKKKAR